MSIKNYKLIVSIAICFMVCCLSISCSKKKELNMSGIEVTNIGNCLNAPRWWGQEAVLQNGKVLIAGGQIYTEGKEVPISSVEIVDPKNCTSVNLVTPMSAERRGTNPVILSDGRVLLFGGGSSTNIDIYNPVINKISVVGTMKNARSGSAKVVLSNGQVLTTGGYNKAPNGSGKLKSAEIFNPVTKQSILIGNMNYERASHSIASLGDGQYLITGGGGEASNIAEIYNEKTGSFTVIDSKLNFGRKDHRAIVDNKGRIWIIGGTGSNGKSVSEIEYYDSDKKKFILTNLKLSEAREDLAALYIPELNIIVVAGGEHKGVEGDPPSAAVDVIDLDNMKVTSSKLPNGGRDEATLVLENVNKEKGTATLVLLQGLGVDHKPIPSERLTIKK